MSHYSIIIIIVLETFFANLGKYYFKTCYVKRFVNITIYYSIKSTLHYIT